MEEVITDEHNESSSSDEEQEEKEVDAKIQKLILEVFS